ncbi:hypothetical protein, conserved [Plasmodium gonderi]|uniref:Uncharacterized protein n=1 Tax=Plasmodium gonderi TaxID=77519 RepID=A0A1Y1JM20_PLAGO|nr:hypothetical protein, conserved [Plasmodium gonderi]GAW82515.1 hypothetical protein, conserved [Plasmodium gonderi]
MEVPHFYKRSHGENFRMNISPYVNSLHKESIKYDETLGKAACENANEGGAFFQNTKLIGKRSINENLEKTYASSLEEKQKKNPSVKIINNEQDWGRQNNQSDNNLNSAHYNRYYKNLGTIHQIQVPENNKNIHNNLIYSSQDIYSDNNYDAKLVQKEQPKGIRNMPTGTKHKSEIISTTKSIQQVNRKHLIDNCSYDGHSDCEKTTTYNSEQNLLEASQINSHLKSEQNVLNTFRNNIYVDSEQTLFLENTDNDTHSSKEVLNNISSLNCSHQVYSHKGEPYEFTNNNTQILFDKENGNNQVENQKQKEQKILAHLPSEKSVYLTNEAHINYAYKGKDVNIWDHKIPDEEHKNGKNSSYKYESKGNDEMYDSLNGHQNNHFNMANVNAQIDMDSHESFNKNLSHNPRDDLLYINHTFRENEKFNKYLNHSMNNYVFSKGNVNNDETVKKLSIPRKRMTHNSTGQKSVSVKDGFMRVNTYSKNNDFKKIKMYQSNGFPGMHSSICSLSTSNLYHNPDDIITGKLYYPPNHSDNANDHTFKRINGSAMKNGNMCNVDTPSFKNDVFREMGYETPGTLIDQLTIPKEIKCNGEDKLNNNLNNPSQKINHIIRNFDESHKYTCAKNYLNRFVENHYNLDEIKNCIPERVLYTNHKFDVPQIIQGITTKHNNGFVSECNQDTVIEYNNKWILVKGKQFGINQKENFKSVEDSAKYFQNYLDEQNNNTKRILSNSTFNSLTGKLNINSSCNDENLRDLSKVYDYKDTLRSYPAYYGISQHMKISANKNNRDNEMGKEKLENMEETPTIKSEKDYYYDCKNGNKQTPKKKSIVKKQKLALCGDFQLKNRIKDFVSEKMKDCFSINFL